MKMARRRLKLFPNQRVTSPRRQRGTLQNSSGLFQTDVQRICPSFSAITKELTATAKSVRLTRSDWAARKQLLHLWMISVAV
jgi:hypothetical protein